MSHLATTVKIPGRTRAGSDKEDEHHNTYTIYCAQVGLGVQQKQVCLKENEQYGRVRPEIHEQHGPE